MNSSTLKPIFWATLSLCVLTGIAIAAADSGLRTEITPYGIVSFEFCGLNGSCEDALAAWGANGQKLVMFSLGIDYLFLLLYPATLFLSLWMMAEKVPQKLKQATRLAALATPLISLADAVENYASIQVVLSGSGDFYGMLAAVFALIKFTVLDIAALWLLFTWIKYSVLQRR